MCFANSFSGGCLYLHTLVYIKHCINCSCHVPKKFWIHAHYRSGQEAGRGLTWDNHMRFYASPYLSAEWMLGCLSNLGVDSWLIWPKITWSYLRVIFYMSSFKQRKPNAFKLKKKSHILLEWQLEHRTSLLPLSLRSLLCVSLTVVSALLKLQFSSPLLVPCCPDLSGSSSLPPFLF